MNSSNSLFVRPFGSEKKNLILVYKQEFNLSAELISRIVDFFKNEKRVATFSIGLSENSTSNPIRCNNPFGSAFVINLELCPLVGDFPISHCSVEQVQHWANEATRRGLFHYWISGAPEYIPSIIGMSAADQLEATDSLTPLGNYLSGSTGKDIDILVDCAWLGRSETGSQKATVEILKRMVSDERVRKISLYDLPDGLPLYAKDLEESPKIQIVSLSDARYHSILWRPYQPGGEVDFKALNERARRIVMTYLDLIAYSNEHYHQTTESWLGYRSTLRLVAARCDGVIAISQDVKKQLLENFPTLEESRVFAIPLGIDSQPNPQPDMTRTPRNISDQIITSKNYIVCLGTNFAHKNRDLALKVVQEVRDRGYELELVFAGLLLEPSISGEINSSLDKRNLPDWVRQLGSVNSSDRDWLLANAKVALYPTSAEGFGLVPFEAALFNTPIAATNFGPLSELVSPIIGSKSWTVSEYANEVEKLLHADNAKQQIDTILTSAQQFTWDSCAQQIVDSFIYVAALEKNRANIASAEFEKQLQQAQIRFNHELHAITRSISWRITAPIRALHRKLLGK